MNVYLAYGFNDYDGGTFLAAFGTADAAVAYLTDLAAGDTNLDTITFDAYGYYVATLGDTSGAALTPVFVGGSVLFNAFA